MWIEELPNGKYKYYERYIDPYTEKSRKVSLTLNSKSNQAKKQATVELQEKINKKINAPKLESITFEKALELFKPNYKRKVKNSSYLSFESTEKTLLRAIGKDMLIKNIDLPFFRKRIEDLYYDQKYSLNYVKKIKAFTLMILSHASEEGYSAGSPNFKLNLVLRQDEKPEKYLEKYELRAVIDQLNKMRPNQRKADMVEFLALTGLRYGELIALREEDLYEGYISVNGTIDFRNGSYSNVTRTTPKTKAANRNVVLSTRATNILIKILQENQLYKATSKYIDSGYIFTSPNGNPIDYRTFAPCLKNAAKFAGIQKPVSSHYLRHTHISFLAELNIPIKVVMDRVGHNDASTTLQVYTHVTNKMKDTLKDKIETINY